MNWAVDFAGGTEMEVKFTQPVTSAQIEDSARKAGIADLTIQALGGGTQQYLLRFDRDEKKTASTDKMATEQSISVDNRTDKFKANLAADLAAARPEILRIDYVGPQVGKELRTQGAVSLVYALIGIVLYIMLRFDIRFAPGSVVKMIMDILLTLGFYVLAQRSFDLTSIAALLTVAGYTVNDTVVIYDRIRENLELHPGRPLRQNVNNAINETLGRSINTSVCTLLSLLGIIFFATGSIWNFAMAMAIGVIAATWSSTFLATMCVVWFEGWKRPKALQTRTVS
jgi:preprotein translocase SecF subunit